MGAVIDVPFDLLLDVDLLARLMRLAAAAACGVWLVRHRPPGPTSWSARRW